MAVIPWVEWSLAPMAASLHTLGGRSGILQYLWSTRLWNGSSGADLRRAFCSSIPCLEKPGYCLRLGGGSDSANPPGRYLRSGGQPLRHYPGGRSTRTFAPAAAEAGSLSSLGTPMVAGVRLACMLFRVAADSGRVFRRLESSWIRRATFTVRQRSGAFGCSGGRMRRCLQVDDQWLRDSDRDHPPVLRRDRLSVRRAA